MLRYFAAPADNSKSKAQFVKLRANNVRLFTERSENWGVYLIHLPLHKDRISYNLSFLKVLKDSTKIAIVSLCELHTACISTFSYLMHQFCCSALPRLALLLSQKENAWHEQHHCALLLSRECLKAENQLSSLMYAACMKERLATWEGRRGMENAQHSESSICFICNIRARTQHSTLKEKQEGYFQCKSNQDKYMSEVALPELLWITSTNCYLS